MDPLLLTLICVVAFAAGTLVGWFLRQRVSMPSAACANEEQLEEIMPKAQENEVEAKVEPAPTPALEASKTKKPQPRPATELGLHLFSSRNPLAELKSWTRRVFARATDETAPSPSLVELFLARQLSETGLTDTGFSLPQLKVVRPHTNGMFYLRLPTNSETYGDTLSMLRIEAALNAGVFVEELFSEQAPQDEEEMYAALATLTQRITEQVSYQSPSSDTPDGEWAARMALSNALERLRLPHRLVSTFRMNLASGVAAIEFEVTPQEVFPRSALVQDSGIVPTTPDMRNRLQAEYTMRLVVLLARCAFTSSDQLEHVWVAAIERTPESHACLLSAAFNREDIERFEQDALLDVESFLADSEATIQFDQGKLSPCEQGFSLNDERFCPPVRYDAVELSSRMLEPREAEALGATQVCDLEIDEALRREHFADEIAFLIPQDGGGSCQEAVRVVMELSDQTEDETLRQLALRTAQHLVEGTLEPDPLAVVEDLCDDGGLAQTVEQAQGLLVSGMHEQAEKLMAQKLAPYDESQAYSDTAHHEWRAFSNYVDRVLYNLMLARENITTQLAPEAYVEALITHSMALLILGRGEEALVRARRACAMCPMSAMVRLHLVQCLEVLGMAEEAKQQLVILLTHAHDTEGLAFGYFRMAMILWQEGKVSTAHAAYQRSMSFMSPATQDVLKSMGAALAGIELKPTREMTPQELERELTSEGIPFAPTQEITNAFMKAAQAALDAEIFPVARDFLRVLGAVSRDDVVFGVFRSLEDEPDR